MIKGISFSLQVYPKRANARNPEDVPAWLSLILAARRVPVGRAKAMSPIVRRESPMGDSFENCPE